MISFLRRMWKTAAAEINPSMRPPELSTPSWIKQDDAFAVHASRCVRCRVGRTLCDEGGRLFEIELRKGRK